MLQRHRLLLLRRGPAEVSLRPDFVATLYPVVTMQGDYTPERSRRGLLGEWGKMSGKLRDSLSVENHISDDYPPVFLMNCLDDPTWLTGITRSSWMRRLPKPE